jgi:hypothetical protein
VCLDVYFRYLVNEDDADDNEGDKGSFFQNQIFKCRKNTI